MLRIIVLKTFLYAASIFTIFLALPGLTVQAATTSGYSASPQKLVVSGNPGQEITLTVSLSNIHKDVTLPLGVTFMNFTPQIDGTPKATKDVLPTGIATWVKGANTKTLNPGQTDEYKAVLAVPKNTAPGAYYGILLFNNTANISDPAVGVIVIANIGSTSSKLTIEKLDTTGLQITQQWKANGQVVLAVKGTGTAYTVPEKIVIEILDQQKNVVETTDANPTKQGVLPNYTQTFTAPINKLLAPNQTYSARAKIYLSANDQPITAESAINVPGYISTTKTAPNIAAQPKPKRNPLFYVGAGIAGVLISALIGFLLHDRAVKKRNKQPAAAPSAEAINNQMPLSSNSPANTEDAQPQNQDSTID